MLKFNFLIVGEVIIKQFLNSLNRVKCLIRASIALFWCKTKKITPVSGPKTYESDAAVLFGRPNPLNFAIILTSSKSNVILTLFIISVAECFKVYL